jgi:hypothetical protein
MNPLRISPTVVNLLFSLGCKRMTAFSMLAKHFTATTKYGISVNKCKGMGNLNFNSSWGR